MPFIAGQVTAVEEAYRKIKRILEMPRFRCMKNENSDGKNEENKEKNNEKMDSSKKFSDTNGKSDNSGDKKSSTSSINSTIPKAKGHDMYPDEMKSHYLNNEEHQEYVAQYLRRVFESELDRDTLHDSFKTVSGVDGYFHLCI